MGLSLSRPQNENALRDFIDEVASKYILSQNFNDLTNLNDDNYCNNLILISSEILYTQFNLQEIEYLNSEIKGKVSEKVALLHKNNLDSYDIPQPKKKLLCMAISEFYIKVSSIFSAIQVTLNGEKYDSGLNNIQKNETNVQENSCMSKINKLVESIKPAYDYPSNEIIIYPYICNKNNSNEINNALTNVNTELNPLTLFDENGIKELNRLYENETVGFEDLMKKELDKDLETFYRLFNNKSIPVENGEKTIKSFQDIKIENVNDFCNENLIEENKKYIVDKRDKIVMKYVKHIKNIIKNINKIKNKLLKILQKIFIFKVYTLKDGKTFKTIVINPSLTFSELDNINLQTKNILVDYFTICNNETIKGKKMLLAIIKHFEIKQDIITLEEIKDLEKEEAKMEENAELRETTEPAAVPLTTDPPVVPLTTEPAAVPPTTDPPVVPPTTEPAVVPPTTTTEPVSVPATTPAMSINTTSTTEPAVVPPTVIEPVVVPAPTTPTTQTTSINPTSTTGIAQTSMIVPPTTEIAPTVVPTTTENKPNTNNEPNTQ